MGTKSQIFIIILHLGDLNVCLLFAINLTQGNASLKLCKFDQYVINKGYFSEAFLFKPRGGRSPLRCLNRKPRKNPLFSL